MKYDASTERWLSNEECGDRLGVKAATVAKWIRQGRLSAIRLGYRTCRVSESEFQRFIEQLRAATSTNAA
jgi:excisionase family DNA binding protein